MSSGCLDGSFVLRYTDIEGMASVLTYVSFFVTICYHTLFARPWIYPPLALYGLDLLMRLFRFRIKDASLVPMKDMTIVRTQILPPSPSNSRSRQVSRFI